MMKTFGVICCMLPTLLLVSTASNPDEKLYLVKIHMRPTVGRNEAQVIGTIKTLFNDISGIEVLHLFKEIANPYILAVVDVKDDCRWPALTSVLFGMDEQYSAVPLYGCENFAKELGVDLTGLTRNFGNGTLHVAEMLFYQAGHTTEKYLEILKDILTKTNNEIQTNVAKLACFRVLSDVPFKMIFLSNVHPSQNKKLIKDFKLPERAHVTVRAYDNLNDYVC